MGYAEGEESGVVAGPVGGVLGQDLAEVADDSVRALASAVGECPGQGLFPKEGALCGAVALGRPCLGGAVGVEQQGIAGFEAEPGLGKRDVGDYAEQRADLANIPYAAVGPQDQCGRMARGADPAGHPAWRDLEGHDHGGHEPFGMVLGDQGGIEVPQDSVGRQVMAGGGALGVPGQVSGLGCLGTLSAHIAYHRAPPRPPDMKQVVEIPDHVGAASCGYVGGGHLKAGDWFQDRRQQAVLEAAGQFPGQLQGFLRHRPGAR